jgi:hypothetical protein
LPRLSGSFGFSGLVRRSDLLFELGDITAGHGTGEVEGDGGTGERAQFRHPGEDSHALELIHGRAF